jgi:hypothetical protein
MSEDEDHWAVGGTRPVLRTESYKLERGVELHESTNQWWRSGANCLQGLAVLDVQEERFIYLHLFPIKGDVRARKLDRAHCSALIRFLVS